MKVKAVLKENPEIQVMNLKRSVVDAVERYVAFRRAEKDAAAGKDKAKDDLLALHEAGTVPALSLIDLDRFKAKVTFRVQEQRRLSESALLAAGVPQAVIDSCKTVTASLLVDVRELE